MSPGFTCLTRLKRLRANSPQITQITQIKSMDYGVSREVIGCAMRVHRALGNGFIESVYENALAMELKSRGISFRRQAELLVRYRGQVVGRFYADLIIENKLLLELKATKSLCKTSESQLLNYLHASNIQTGLLINFGSISLQFKRMTIAQS